MKECICIKDFRDPTTKFILFKKNKHYKYEYEHYNVDSDDYQIECDMWLEYNKDGFIGEVGYRFIDTKKVYREANNDFHKYFIKYDRKTKLERLNEKMKQ